ncbi:FTR1 family iron permease [Orenia marismortui]|uniref:High-affinity iron transporter n=1 Tax=Orenia marismortui TaxID=46469 RepID=A0A4R8GSP7_9FIRM|nr:FTR1 family protein [Orenia marismortui]TDX48947.1 high-affinity iron transporter [Orenia marismortui]
MKNKFNKLLLTFFMLAILVLSLNTNTYAASWHDVREDIKIRINKGLDLYEEGNLEKAKKSITDAYFIPFEGEEMEQAIQRYIGGQNAFKVEYMFSQIKKLMDKGADKHKVKALSDRLVKELDAYATKLDELAPREDDSPFAKFLYSFMIILREGFEAILVIGAILAYLIKSGNEDKVKTVYNSSFVAIIASILTAFLFKYVFHISGLGQELLEGITMLLAMVVLFSVSFWLISKVEAKKWDEYIKGKVKDSLATGNSWALWSAVFLAVYREGAETVLFYQALFAKTDKSAYGMIGLGFLVGCVALAIIYMIVKKGSMKLPLKPFFVVTSGLLYYLAFVFAGQGIRELQEASVIGATKIEGFPTISWLGVYPTWQTLSLQIVLVIIAVIALVYSFNGSKQKV